MKCHVRDGCLLHRASSRIALRSVIHPFLKINVSLGSHAPFYPRGLSGAVAYESKLTGCPRGFSCGLAGCLHINRDLINFAVRITKQSKISENMKELTNQQWEDVRSDINSRHCPACGYNGRYTKPHYGTIGDLDVLAVSCVMCGRVEIYDVNELAAIADAFNEKCVDRGQRKPGGQS